MIKSQHNMFQRKRDVERMYAKVSKVLRDKYTPKWMIAAFCEVVGQAMLDGKEVSLPNEDTIERAFRAWHLARHKRVREGNRGSLVTFSSTIFG